MNNAGSGAARVLCPQCRANNFAGKTHCWQCAAPLPPPEAIRTAARGGQAQGGSAPNPASWQTAQPGPAPRSNPAQTQFPSPQPVGMTGGAGDGFVQKWGMSKPIAALIVATGLGAFLLVWTVGGKLRGVSDPVKSAPAASAPLFAPPTRETPAVQPAPDDTDPIVAESKRFIERESRHAGLPEPPASDDGRVHLRGGGSISADQYRDAQRRVQESPVLHTPIPAPPMP